MADKVWTVYGQSGCFDDRSWWIVRCFTDKAEAERFVVELEKRVEAAVDLWRVATQPAKVDWSSIEELDADHPNMDEDTYYRLNEVDLGWPQQSEAKKETGK